MDFLPLKKTLRQSKPPKLYLSRRPSQFRSTRVHHHVCDSLIVDDYNLYSPLDSYNIYAQLGAGEFGQTLRVSLNGRYSALKKTQDSYQSRVELISYLLSRSETVPQIYNAWTENEELFIDMELADCNLTELMQTIYPTEELAWAILGDVGRAIMAIQNAGFYHLDVKMDNVLVKVLRKENSALEMSSVVGSDALSAGPPVTSRYRPPLDRMGLRCEDFVDKVVFLLSDFGNACRKGCEQVALGDSRYCQNDFIQSHTPSAECDSYALGVTIFELCTQVELPVEGDYFALFRKAPFLLIKEWRFSKELRDAVGLLMAGIPLSEVTRNYAHRLLARSEIYANLSNATSNGRKQFVHVKAKKRFPARQKDERLLSMCLLCDRSLRARYSPLEDLQIDDCDNFEMPQDTNLSGELLAVGLELSF